MTQTMPKVLISDRLSSHAVDVFRERGIEVDVMVGMTTDELIEKISKYHGLGNNCSSRGPRASSYAKTPLRKMSHINHFPQILRLSYEGIVPTMKN